MDTTATMPSTKALRPRQGLTAEEEMREIHSLSAREIASVQADLIGLGNSMSGLHISRSNSSASPVDQAQMMEIAKAMGSLPQSETEAYNKALQLCPDQVLDPCRMQMFLDYATEQEEPDRENKMGTYFRAVATQLAKYWKVREYIFNNVTNGSGDNDDTKTMNAAYLPMTQAGALTPAGAMQLANRKVFQLLAQPDTSGGPSSSTVPLERIMRNIHFMTNCRGCGISSKRSWKIPTAGSTGWSSWWTSVASVGNKRARVPFSV